MRAREVSMIPQLDEPKSFPIRGLTEGRMNRLSGQIEQDPSQGGTYMQKATVFRRREYPEEGDGNDNYRRPSQDQRPPDRGGYPNGGRRPPDRRGYPNGDGRPPDRGGLPNRGRRPPDREGYPGGGPPDRDGGPPGRGYPGRVPLLEEEDPLDLPEDKDHQVLKDILCPWGQLLYKLLR